LAIVVATGEVTDWKKDFQFFETPGDVVDRMIHRAGLNSEMSILEPSAGLGAILSGIMYQAGLRRTMAVEINPKMARDLNNRFWRTGMITRERDFLTCGSELGRFDRILMNPPFSRGQDIAHVAHAWEMLKSGGRLVAITSPGWEFRTDSKHCRFRDWLTCLPKTIIENLPEGTFKSSGTNVRAKLITLNKPEGQQ
jgi:protein-L-isoaspartate O-methyltransferase